VTFSSGGLGRDGDRQAGDKVVRIALNNPVDGAHRQTVTVRIAEALVLPGLRGGGQGIGVHLAGGQHHLTHLAADEIAIDVDIIGAIVADIDLLEFVVGLDGLKLRVDFAQILVVPEPDIVERVAIRLETGGGQAVVGGEVVDAAHILQSEPCRENVIFRFRYSCSCVN